ncbi:MAG: InlB B-repeat-containing protein [Clostridiales bacterium]|nr:InlB B-repeat-containing protein [Clostridiales bacterium]
MRKTVSIILAVCISLLSSLTLFGCDTIKAPEVSGDTRFYRYNAETEVYDKTEYVEIDGDKCSLVKDNNGITVTSTGAITFTKDSFTIVCASNLLGITITNIMNGQRESNGVLRVDSQTVIGMTATPVTDYDVIYYCRDGVKPISPTVQYTITFDANGGKFDGEEQRKTVKTSTIGTVSLPSAPTRSGYDFVGYFDDKTSGNTPITSSTVFERSMTVYARWTERNSAADRYYYYDAESDSLNMNDYIDIDGTSVMMVTISGGTTVRNSGSAMFIGNSFTITINGQTTVVLRGERESNGILRFTSVTLISDGTEIEDTSVFYYCPFGVKPPKQQGDGDDENGDNDDKDNEHKTYEITFNAAPGKFPDGTTLKTIDTDENGKLKSFPDNPTRSGYRFNGFTSGYYSGYITSDTVFTRSISVTAEYTRMYTVEFTVEGVTTETRLVEQGEPLGDYEIPDVPDYSKYNMFKGWYEKGSSYTYYTPKTVITKDVTLTAQFYTHDDAHNYNLSMAKWSAPGHVYIHYLRKDGEIYPTDKTISTMLGTAYEDWMLWAWPRNGEGRAFAPIRTGMYGVVYDIDMKKTYTDGGWDATNKTNLGKTVNYFKCDLGLMFFNDKSRYNGSAMWENDGGNLYLNYLWFVYWDPGDESNKKYFFDDNYSVHFLFVQGSFNQTLLDNFAIQIIVFKNDYYTGT